MNQPVLWLEGMFIEPQHFQQLERHLKTQKHALMDIIQSDRYGLLSFGWQESLLATQKLSLTEVSAIFQDGYFIDSSKGDLLPDVIDVPKEMKHQWIYLGLPIIKENKKNIFNSGSEEEQGRFKMAKRVTADITSAEFRSNEIVVGEAKPKLLFDRHPQYLCLKLAKILEVDPAGKIIFAEQAMPTWLNINMSAAIQLFYQELLSLLTYRINYLRESVSDLSTYHLQSLSDLLMLSCLSRYSLRISELQAQNQVHPAMLYSLLRGLYTEISIRDANQKEIKPYQHQQQDQFWRLIDTVRERLTQGRLDQVISLNLQPYEMDSLQANIPDQGLIDHGQFILAVHGHYPAEELKQNVLLFKLATPGKIKDLIELQLPGVKLTPVAQIPNVMPYYRDYVYFEVELNDADKAELKKDFSFVLHVPQKLSDLKIQLWAVRNEGEKNAN